MARQWLQWELFGEMVPVKNRDLWQRVDQALRFHKVHVRTWRFDLPHDSSAAGDDGAAADDSTIAACTTLTSTTLTSTALSETAPEGLAQTAVAETAEANSRWSTLSGPHFHRRAKAVAARATRRWFEGCWLWLSQCGTRLAPQPWLD